MTDWGAHHIDIAQWALGYENSGPIEIEGWGELPEVPNGYNTATKFEITLKYDNGNKMIVRNGPGNGISMKGDKSELYVARNKFEGKLVDELTEDDKDWLDDEVIKLYNGKEPRGHMQNFIDCIKDRKQPISDVFTHHRSMTSCHLCNIAIQLNRKLQWDPAKEDFIGDKEASQKRSREQRKPYEIHV
jgi:myo-inositol 2-dehydrogenase/D-chiro-inositol 1-dehydrogenase